VNQFWAAKVLGRPLARRPEGNYAVV